MVGQSLNHGQQGSGLVGGETEAEVVGLAPLHYLFTIKATVRPQGDGSLPGVQVSRLRDLGEWIATHGEALIGARPAPTSVDFYGPATVRDNRLYLHLVAQPVENVVVRGIPVRRVRRVSLLGAGAPLLYRLPLAAYDDHLPGFDVLAELIIDAPPSSGALLEVIAIDFDGPLEV